MVQELYKKYLENPIVTTDSRSVPVGSLFFALKGDNFDGNRFAKGALEAGASVAIIDDPNYCTDGCVLVDNVLKTLQQLANYHRKKLQAKIIGITGSNGKTTTKELLAAVLSMKYNVYATKGNLNNHIGVPLTLLSLPKQTEIAIIEMGANHPGDIKELVDIAEPDFGLITNIGRAHLGGFGSFEGVVNTKAELYEFIARNKGNVFYNDSNSILKELIGKFNLEHNSIAYSSICSNFEITHRADNPFLSLGITVENKTFDINTSLVGDYNKENVLASFTVGRFFDVSTDKIKEAIEQYTPTNIRSQFLRTDNNIVILDAYNANPSSMEAAIRNFYEMNSPNKKLILGEMLELGEYTIDEHRKIVDLLVDLKFRDVVLVGYGFMQTKGDYTYFDNVEACLEYLKKQPVDNATILLKGSRGVRLEKLMDVL
ncbi:MAG: UDP-N-acetylmuramoyl-tripeptide--D-alanyl-D-alanine ligase [Bacteroidales bacterium]